MYQGEKTSSRTRQQQPCLATILESAYRTSECSAAHAELIGKNNPNLQQDNLNKELMNEEINIAFETNLNQKQKYSHKNVL